MRLLRDRGCPSSVTLLIVQRGGPAAPSGVCRPLTGPLLANLAVGVEAVQVHSLVLGSGPLPALLVEPGVDSREGQWSAGWVVLLTALVQALLEEGLASAQTGNVVDSAAPAVPGK